MWFVRSSKLQSGFILELLLVWLLVCFFVSVVVVGGGVFFCGLVCARGPFVWWAESKRERDIVESSLTEERR